MARTQGAKLHKLVVGVDFGTTYTGVSYMSTAKEDEVNCVRSW